MRTRRRVNPKLSPMTPEQEAEHTNLVNSIEKALMEARILERGIAYILNQTDEYTNDVELEQVHKCLLTAVILRQKAQDLRASCREIERAAEQESPAKKERGPKIQ